MTPGMVIEPTRVRCPYCRQPLPVVAGFLPAEVLWMHEFTCEGIVLLTRLRRAYSWRDCLRPAALDPSCQTRL